MVMLETLVRSKWARRPPRPVKLFGGPFSKIDLRALAGYAAQAVADGVNGSGIEAANEEVLDEDGGSARWKRGSGWRRIPGAAAGGAAAGGAAAGGAATGGADAG
jgi:hypothetical protein